MNVYDFDGTIYNGDSSVDIYFFLLKRYPKLIAYFPKQILGIVKYKQIYGHSFISRGYCNSTVCDYKISKHRFEIKGW